jgi:ABC-type transport system involved in multi-copper enzyme maturation permease subunit
MSIGERGFLDPLRAVAIIAAAAGAVGSVGLTLYVGRHNASRILLSLFVIWVLSPFVALVFASVVSKRWPVLTRTALYSAMLVLTLGSLATYGNVAVGSARAKPAFAFLVVPLASWLVIAIVVAAAAFISRRVSRQDASV